jgi:DNA repair protein RecO (recombination protein O)
MEYRYTGIVLGKRDVGETDRLYTILTLETGKIQCLAKSVRKLQAKLAGFLENFTLTEIFIAKNQGAGKIKGSLVENNFPNIRKSYEALLNVSKILNMLDRILIREEKDEKTFSLLRDFLQSMDKAIEDGREDRINILSLGFIFKMFESLGYKIKADCCSNCSKKLSQEGNFFSFENGGVVCPNCAGEISQKIRILSDSVKIIRIFHDNKIQSLSKLKVGKKEVDNLNLISNLFFQWIS